MEAVAVLQIFSWRASVVHMVDPRLSRSTDDTWNDGDLISVTGLKGYIFHERHARSMS